MILRHVAVAAALIALTLAGFFFFPGHTFLYSDTQIYLPILERMHDSSLYSKEPLALRPHVTYTIYDEMALALRRVTGLEFQSVLVMQQLATRFCGLLGMFLIGRAIGFPTHLALLLTSIYALGATVSGPAVLIFEYEPVPRGFAGPMLVLAIGLAARNRWLAAGLTAGVAILYHPPTTVPVLAVLALFTIFQSEYRIRSLRAWAAIAVSIVLAFIFSRLQDGVTEAQQFFGRIPPDLEQLQRLRGAYVWITMWGAQWIRHFELLFVACLLVYWRIRTFLPPVVRYFFLGLPIYGIVMMPLSYLSLETAKWSLMPQFQPARAVLFLSLIALAGAGICGIHAARSRRYVEALAWFALAYAIPAQADVSQLLLPDLRDSIYRKRFGVTAALALLATAAAAFESRKPVWSRLALGACLILPFYAIPKIGQVINYREIDHPEIHEVANWARQNTSKDAVFLFPDAGQDLTPGLFRVYAVRAVFVDWKAGGQVNLLPSLGLEWWRRWKAVMEGKFEPGNMRRYTGEPIDYLVVKKKNAIEGWKVLYENEAYRTYAVPRVP